MQALILAGGSGTRFWPLSRSARPKQMLSMVGDESLMQVTASRLSPLVEPESIWICTTRSLVEQVRRQLPAVPFEQVLAEPTGRNTAPAIAWAISQMPKDVRAGVIAVLPADHYVEDEAAFREALRTAGEIAADQNRIMTLGVPPTRAETGYGYLELGEVLDSSTGLRQVKRFTEKPDPGTAEEFYSSGNYLWNAGIFVFPGDVLLQRVAELQPEIDQGLAAVRAVPERLAEIYRELPAISIDHAVMEKLLDLGTLPLDCGWSDLGSWEALWELLEQDAEGNIVRGSALAIDSKDCLVYSDRGTVAVVGVEGLVVVKTADAVLVIPKKRSQEVRQIIQELRDSQREDLL
jgi:mannose-1-phosphate guanylyltransferase